MGICHAVCHRERRDERRCPSYVGEVDSSTLLMYRHFFHVLQENTVISATLRSLSDSKEPSRYTSDSRDLGNMSGQVGFKNIQPYIRSYFVFVLLAMAYKC